MPRFCEFYLGICLTTEEKHGKTSVRVRKNLSQGKCRMLCLLVALPSFTFSDTSTKLSENCLVQKLKIVWNVDIYMQVYLHMS